MAAIVSWRLYGLPMRDPGAVIDAGGAATSWERDLAGRVVPGVRADSRIATIYAFGASSVVSGTP